MKMEKMKKYKTEYYGTNNDNIISKKEYEPEKYIVRKTNEDETITYEEITINHKLDWENTMSMYENTLIEEIEEQIKRKIRL